MYKVVHVISLYKTGGVQKSFVEYFNSIRKEKKQFKHDVYLLNHPKTNFTNVNFKYHHLSIFKPVTIIKFLSDLRSKKVVVHIYNRLGSLKFFLLLLLFKSNNILIHERGTAWNISEKRKNVFGFFYKKADRIITNSYATLNLLNKKFGLSVKKLTTVYNGIKIKKISKTKNYKKNFTIGFLGRLDTPKGAHVMLNLAKEIKKKNIKILIGGDGVFKSQFIKESKNLSNIKFLGHIKDSYKFLKSIDLLIVPSIREPFGNIILEAGLCKIPVLAALVDGIPEIIKNNYSGSLIKPTKKLTLNLNVAGSLPIPEKVYDPISKSLVKPKELDTQKIIKKINYYLNNPLVLKKLSNNLHQDVKKKFSINIYKKRMNIIYKKVLGL